MIDIDICPSKRGEIFKRIREERGQLGCVQVCTYGVLSTKAAIKISAKGYRSEEYPEGIDLDEAEYLTSLAPSERGFVWSLHDCLEGNPEKNRKPVREMVEEVSRFPGLKKIMLGIEGCISQRGVHASGVNFYGEDPFETACFMKAKDGSIITQYSLHDCEFCGDVKFDYLVTEVQEIITQCLFMLQEHKKIEQNLTLRQMYNKYLRPEVLPIKDQRIWDALAQGSVPKLFQFDTLVGGQTAKKLKPQSPLEMANCNSIMRLMAQDQGGETPSDRYKRMKDDMSQWYREMNQWGLSEEEQKILEPYYLPSYASPAQQEDLMRILMDKDICGFTLAEGNFARKVCSKKKMDQIPALHEKVLAQAPNKNFGEYVWETAIKPQMGYSFSLIHSLAYSYIGIQTIYLATYFPRVYWNCACLRVDSGLDEDASSSYGKIAKAVGNMIDRGINVSPININASQYMFEPDEENNAILYGMKALSGFNGESIKDVVAGRPYKSFEDFLGRTSLSKTSIISLIKSGAFDQMQERQEVMETYLRQTSGPKSRVTMQNFKALMEASLLPPELEFQQRLFVFDKALRKYQKSGDTLFIENNYYDFYQEFFDLDLLRPQDDRLTISVKEWKKLYDAAMRPAKDYLTEHSQDLLDALNDNLFQEEWNKYCGNGSYALWEMDSMGYYYHPHELTNVNKLRYNIVRYRDLPSEPPAERTFKGKNGRTYSTYKTCRICGTVVSKDNIKSSIELLTPDSGVVTVKFRREYFAKFNRRLSENVGGKSEVRELGWFNKGNKLVVNGFRRGDTFMERTYRKTASHGLYFVDSIGQDGTIKLRSTRWGEEEEE